MKYDLVIKNGKAVTAVTTFPADIAINGETIAAVGLGLHGRREIDAAGKLVLPGAVDMHVHLQMPIGRFVSTDDFYSGTAAAACGGTTSIIDFVETAPEETMVAAIAARRALADPRVVVDYGLHMTITPGDIPKLDQVPAAFAAGCTSFKLYMAYGHRLNDGQLLQALTAVHAVGGLPVVHAENWDVIQALVAENVAHGRTTPHWHPRSRPALFEAEATGRVIDIAAFVGTPVHIFHVSCGAAAARIATARARGLPVTGETCPQYLFLTQDVYDRPGIAGALPVCSPPIREEFEQAALWTAVQRGDLQVITTDHCPFTAAEKATGLANYSQIPGGVPSIEMRLAAVYGGGVARGLLTLPQWVDLCCTTPARLMGLARKGHIAPSYDADVVIFDPEAPWTVTPQTLHETAGWTPYEGLALPGRVQTTIIRGQVVAADGELQVGAGYGRYLRT
ncbi:MAG: dihydropyrimidinase [Chloroflexi bacterium]|nr:dihydropyrimidinase [Ardenticatenaceae bacterium]MBL1128804.1 dihydropyrimidinase [Chloroflexota bacterium]NOG34882.1 dihydropyrimidinase [Chloroflexota bacterium]GIK58871.1 MAG: dihydropyrimidinase [Chloroflexota bacterium]